MCLPVEPDTRGATTIREQLAKTRQPTTCRSCHARIDPAGFALENFDVAGGFREKYRALGDGAKAPGFGKGGHFLTSTMARQWMRAEPCRMGGVSECGGIAQAFAGG
jgi:hypothetical protein